MADNPRPGITTWDALGPGRLPAVMEGAGIPWWVAGGWVIDLFTGAPTRPHTDLDVLVLRSDQHALHGHLAASWPLFHTGADTEDGLAPWQEGATLEAGGASIWIAHPGNRTWAFEVMLMDTDGERWVFRRDRRIGGPVGALGWVTGSGIPVLRPEIQLLFKARDRRARDDRDFATAAPLLGEPARSWLAAAIETHLGAGHQWLGALIR